MDKTGHSYGMTHRLLAYGGLLPFIILALMSVFSRSPQEDNVIGVLQLVYAAMILSFLGGIHWAASMQSGHRAQALLSVMPTLACAGTVVASFFIAPAYGLVLAAVILWLMMIADYAMPLALEQDKKQRYLGMRGRLTVMASAALLITAYCLII
jgi:FtsH-binding integral membrane protein